MDNASEQAPPRGGRGGIVPPVETRWQPGQSANPGGRPKFRAFSKAMRDLAEMTPAALDAYKPKTVAEDLARAAIINAREDPRYLTHLLDRTEGKVPDEHRLSGGAQALQIVLVEAVPPTSQGTGAGAIEEGTDGSEAVSE